MRHIHLLFAVAACTTSDTAEPPSSTHTIETPEFTLAPGEEKTLCYFTTLPTDEPVAVSRYRSSMAPGSHHLIVYTTRTQTQPDGTLGECASGPGQADPMVWAYGAQQPEFTTQFPDGVGVMLAARQPLVVQLHYLNTTDAPIEARATFAVDTLPPDARFEPANAFFTFNTQIDVPPGGTASVSGSCAVPAGAKFFLMSTHSHRFTTRVQVRDGGTMVLETTDWEHPALGAWPAPYQTFASGKLDYRCDYLNMTDQRVTTGDSALTEEMCMAVGYFFPTERPVPCIDSRVISL